MFWRKKSKERTKKAVRKIEGPLWGYMVKKGAVVDVLQNLRYVFAEVEMEGESLFHIRIFDPARFEAAGIAVEDLEPLMIIQGKYFTMVSSISWSNRQE